MLRADVTKTGNLHGYSLDKRQKSAQSEADDELENGPMPLMPEYFLNAIAFIYPSEKDARCDTGFIGAGFLVGIPSPEHPSFSMIYLVTSYHVIKKLKTVTLRFNIKGGGMRFVKDWPLDHWVVNRSFDVAVTPVGGDGLDFAFVPRRLFVDDDKIKQHKIGVGDEVCLIGRVMQMKYVKRNIAMMRFGNISLAPQYEGKTFLVELRSISGHSGSPVVAYCPPYALAGTREQSQMWQGYLLLGINRGHLREYEELVSLKDRKIKSEHWVSETNVALSQVIPAWYIADLLDTPSLVQHRIAKNAELKRKLTGFKEDPAVKRRSVARKSKRAQ